MANYDLGTATGISDNDDIAAAIKGVHDSGLSSSEISSALQYANSPDSLELTEEQAESLEYASELPDKARDASLYNYDGNDNVTPFFIDDDSKVLIGYDSDKEELVGAFPSTAEVATLEALDNSLIPEIKKYNHILSYGQSLSVGALSTNIISTTQPYSNVTFNGGPRASEGDYSAFKPLVEDDLVSPDGGSGRGETICSGAANFAITKAAKENGQIPSEHIILASAPGHGGYDIARFVKGATWYDTVLLDHITNAHILDSDHAVHAFSWMQGETDVDLGTTSYTDYKDQLEQLQVDISSDTAAITGQTHPVLCITYQLSYGIQENSDMAMALLDVVKTNDNFFLSTPMYNLTYNDDGLHLSSESYKLVGAYVGRAYKQLVIDNVKPQFLNPISSTLLDDTITVKFEVPYEPLVFDDMNVGSIDNYGFFVTDDGVESEISSVSAYNNTVVIKLSSSPTGVVKVRYALDYDVDYISNGSAGNLRDSCEETTIINGVETPLYYLCPHFEHTAITLGE